MSMLKKTAVAASVIAALSIATTAGAAPLSQLWFTQNAGWLNDTLIPPDGLVFNSNAAGLGLTFNGFTNPTGTEAPANTFTDFSWSGLPTQGNDFDGGTSSINITSYDDASSDTNFGTGVPVADRVNEGTDNAWNANEFWVIDQLVQTNEALTVRGGVTVPDPLWIAKTLANFRVFGNAARDDLLRADLDSETIIEFYETFNQDDGIACDPENGNLPDTPQCSDVYRIASVELDPIEFERDGYLYTIDFTLIPGPSTQIVEGNPVEVGTSVVCFGPNTNPLAPDFCEEVDVSTGGIPGDEIWVFSPEYNPGTSSLFVAARWNATEIPVPAPGTLGLLGLGLLGLGVATRRKFRAA